MTVQRGSAPLAVEVPVEAARERAFFGHPRGLATLFFTEMWERFSYYGMRGILILFMTAPVASGGLGFDTAKAGAIYGLYTAFVYLAALPGGWVADRLLGQRRSVLVGGVVIALGHFSLAVPTLATFYLGLLLIVTGTGLLKPNISAMVGELYPEGGARRDAGFSIFYMGINLGAFVAPLVCGYLGEKIDWHAGFAAAGVGMVLGLVQYVAGGRWLGSAGLRPAGGADGRAAGAVRRLVGFGAGGVGLVVVLAGLDAAGVVRLTLPGVASAMGVVIAGLALFSLASAFFFGGLEPVERKRIVVIAALFLGAAIFWAGFEQAGSSLNLVAERLTDRTVFGWEMPASWLQSVNPLLIIALAPVFAWLWVALSRRGLEPSSPMKFALGLLLLAAGFVVVAWGTALAAAGRPIGPMWLVVAYLCHTLGELCLSPVGLSAMTKLAPRHMVGQMMGIWFMAAALGNLIAGQVAGRLGGESAVAGEISAQLAMETFLVVAAIAAGAGLVLAALSRPVRGLMGGVR